MNKYNLPDMNYNKKDSKIFSKELEKNDNKLYLFNPYKNSKDYIIGNNIKSLLFEK